jgi:hypothetical protein
MSQEVLKDEKVASAEITTESGEQWILHYFLQSFDGENGEEYFGIRIDKSTPEGVLEEREETPAITENREAALHMAKAFAKGSVPPVVLLEMTDEWFSEVENALMPA